MFLLTCYVWNKDTKSAPRCESLDLLGKPILNSFLDSYIRRDTDRKVYVVTVVFYVLYCLRCK